MFRIAVTCSGLTEAEGSGVVADVFEEFGHRPWHAEVECSWSAGMLSLSASNDYDRTGLALFDEFSDAILACVSPEGPIRCKVVSVVPQ